MAAGILQEQEEGPCHPVGQDVSTGQSDLQPTRLDNINLTSQTPFIPENHAKYPQAGPFAHWISTPTNLQFPPHPNMYGTFSGPASMQNLAYNHQYSQSTLSQNPPYYQHHSQPTLLQTPPYYQQNSQPAHSQTTSYHQQNSQSHPIFQSQHHQNLGQKKAKGQKGHNKQRLSDAQYLVSQTLRDGMVNFQTSINTRWEKSREDQRLRDKTNKQALQEELRMQAQHDVLDLAKKRSSIIDDIDASAEKLILAVKKLEELGPASVLTPNQKLEYELRQRTVSLRKRQYAELNESLQKTEKLSPSQMKPVFGGPRAVTSQRRLDYEEEVNLVDD